MTTALADYEQTEEGEIKELHQDAGTALMALNRSEIDVQIATAKQYPRSIKAFKSECLELATLDEETAASMFYTLPRAGKKIEGPSVRMAEIVGSSYGNLRYMSRIVEIGDEFVTAQGGCMDLQKNIGITVEVKRRITNKEGRRFNDDMIQTTCNAACSIAIREAIFKVVPRALFKDIYEKAKACSVGKATSMAEKRQSAIEWWSKIGVNEKQLLAIVNRRGWEDVTLDDLVTLKGLFTGIKDGETTIDEVLASAGVEAQTGSKVKASALNDKVGQSAKAAPQTAIDRLRALCEQAANSADPSLAFTTIDDKWFGPDAPSWTEDAQEFAAAQKLFQQLKNKPKNGKPSQKSMLETNENTGQ